MRTFQHEPFGRRSVKHPAHLDFPLRTHKKAIRKPADTPAVPSWSIRSIWIFALNVCRRDLKSDLAYYATMGRVTNVYVLDEIGCSLPLHGVRFAAILPISVLLWQAPTADLLGSGQMLYFRGWQSRPKKIMRQCKRSTCCCFLSTALRLSLVHYTSLVLYFLHHPM